MRLRTRLAPTLVLLATLGALSTALASNARSTQADGLRALDGEWIFVEDRTEGRPIEKQQPSMSTRVKLRIEEDAFVLVRRDFEVRMALDGSPTDVAMPYGTSRYRGVWKNGAFEYESVPLRESGESSTGLIRWVLRVTDEGLLASVVSDPDWESIALYRHPEDIALPEPATAAIDDVAWLAGAWDGTRGKSSIEERWSPPRGGAMLGTSRTVRPDKGKMVGFEYLRVVERDGGLVYVAQPGGRPPTEFVLTELGTEMGTPRAVFENPRHDFPQRIVYEFSAEAGLTASTGFAKGGRPRAFEFQREGGRAHTRVHHVEIVSGDVDGQCAALERVHGLSFGPAVADLGGARVAEAPGASRIGVRAPLAAHEQPIIRTYLAVDDIAKAVMEAEAAGAVIAYPPTEQGDTGIWAIYILGGVQMGLWQQ